jgi:ankyrin repeat protein
MLQCGAEVSASELQRAIYNFKTTLDLEVIETLLDSTDNPAVLCNKKDSLNKTPLNRAIALQCAPLVELLLTIGKAEVRVQHLNIVTSPEIDEMLAGYLIAKGPLINQPNENGQTPFHMLCLTKNPFTILVLTEWKKRAEALDQMDLLKETLNQANEAVDAKDEELQKLLIECGAF